MSTTALRVASGSSPLARGLRRIAALVVVMVGIIPARAGFTRAASRGPDYFRDHPRSRGVYSWADTVVSGHAGSSPLARGLLPLWALAAVLLGIIPARAGFTFAFRVCVCLYVDHPRSRGVYAASRCGRSRSSGSSPLARGLPGDAQDRGHARRIIPARAGFTPSRPWPPSWAWDHPRSRGVYASARVSASQSVGSSPLARGLPAGSAASGIARRIIPARAGFTRARRTLPGAAGDHPRSRGVYPALR